MKRHFVRMLRAFADLLDRPQTRSLSIADAQKDLLRAQNAVVEAQARYVDALKGLGAVS